MSAVVSGFGGAGAAGLLAPVASDAASAGGMAFGTALLSALAADPGASTPTTPADPSPSADTGTAETPIGSGAATPQALPPAPAHAVLLGLATPAAPAAPAVQEAVATTTPVGGSHGKQAGPLRPAEAEPRQDAVSPGAADVLAVGQLAVQQAMAITPIPAAAPAPAAPTESPASSAAVEAVTGPAAPPAPAPARDASAQPIEAATVGTGPQPPAAPVVTAPARPTVKTPSEPSAAGAEPATLSVATPLPAQAPAAPTFAAALSAAAPAASATPAPAPPLQQQLAQPVMTLARQPDGDHVVVVRVAPDDLGPVTVHARVSDTGVHIELFAPSDDGREAIRQILTDLRRDLNATTANASVSVSDHNAPGAQSDSGGRSQWAAADERRSTTSADSPEDQAPAPRDIPAPARVLPGARTLDIVV